MRGIPQQNGAFFFLLQTFYYMHSEVPLCTSHGAEPFGAPELARRGKPFTVLTLKHWKWEETTEQITVKLWILQV